MALCQAFDQHRAEERWLAPRLAKFRENMEMFWWMQEKYNYYAIERKCVGLVAEIDGDTGHLMGVRCYHTDRAGIGRTCDCIREYSKACRCSDHERISGNCNHALNRFKLSEECAKIHAAGNLRVNSNFVKLQLEAAKQFRYFHNNMGGLLSVLERESVKARNAARAGIKRYEEMVDRYYAMDDDDDAYCYF